MRLESLLLHAPSLFYSVLKKTSRPQFFFGLYVGHISIGMKLFVTRELSVGTDVVDTNCFSLNNTR